ncbi:MAG: hypothetical protein HQL31_04510, partial [Planctomycetes bacterium]|nr:hypothetical protein [Planctomycetota bacterium]
RKEGRAYLEAHFKHGLQVFLVSNLSWLKLFYGRYEDYSFGGHSPKALLGMLMRGDAAGAFLLARLYELAFTLSLLALVFVGLILRGKKLLADPALVLSAFFIFYVYGVSGVNVWGRFRYLFIPFLVLLAVASLKALREKRT